MRLHWRWPKVICPGTPRLWSRAEHFVLTASPSSGKTSLALQTLSQLNNERQNLRESLRGLRVEKFVVIDGNCRYSSFLEVATEWSPVHSVFGTDFDLRSFEERALLCKLRWIYKLIGILLRQLQAPTFIRDIVVLQARWFVSHLEHPPRFRARWLCPINLLGGCAA